MSGNKKYIEKIVVAASFIICVTHSLYSQVHTNLSSYFKVPLVFNPAAAGAEDHLSVSFIQKEQSIYFPGMPSVTLLSGSLPVNYERVGLGLNLVKESADPSSSLGGNINVSYKINFYKGRLSFGLRSGYIHRRENIASATAKDPENVAGESKGYISQGAGIFYKSKMNFLGVSVDRSASVYTGIRQRLVNSYCLLGGTSLGLSHDVKMIPSFQVRFLNGFPLLAVGTITMEYKKFLTGGLGFSTSLTSTFSAGIDVGKVVQSFNKSILLLYSYDQVWGKLNYLGNTHEVAVVFTMGEPARIEKILKRKITVSPVYFD